MNYVYILQSERKQRYYVGYTGDLEKRLQEHNSGKVRSTKAYKPWKLAYKESFIDKAPAYKREREIKEFKSGIKFKALIKEAWLSGRWRRS